MGVRLPLPAQKKKKLPFWKFFLYNCFIAQARLVQWQYACFPSKRRESDSRISLLNYLLNNMKKIIIVATAVLVIGGIIFISVKNKNNKSQNSKELSSKTAKESQELSSLASQSAADQANQQTQDTKPMGLEIKTTKEGAGDRVVKNGDTITVNYTGKLENGTKFDSSYDRNQPFTFQIGQGQVIQGWEQGLLGMKVGEKRTLTIPADLGYGANGIPGVIPPNATLIFDTELVSIQ